MKYEHQAIMTAMKIFKINNTERNDIRVNQTMTAKKGKMQQPLSI